MADLIVAYMPIMKVLMIGGPIWLYVSITGVVVYWMLWHLAGAHP